VSRGKAAVVTRFGPQRVSAEGRERSNLRERRTFMRKTNYDSNTAPHEEQDIPPPPPPLDKKQRRALVQGVIDKYPRTHTRAPPRTMVPE
jgi:hypothetical protein